MDPSSQSSDQQQSKNQTLESLGKQSSIYSLTLDEFQNTLYESDKTFTSMNMDELLNSIWTAEENQAQAQTSTMPTTNSNAKMQYRGLQDPMHHKGIAKKHSLPRQGTLTIPKPLSRKTVDEVWSEIHKNQHQNNGHEHIQNPNTTQKQTTLGEMTLEDFLVQAGIVREQHSTPSLPHQPGFVMYQNNTHPTMVPTNFVARPIMAVGSGVGVAPPNVATYQTLQSIVGEAAPPGFMKRGDGYSQPPPVINYGARLGNGSGGGFGQVTGSPVSPLSDVNQVDGENQYGGDEMREAWKQVIYGPVEVVERQQRRMIKNRESAARSRARKRDYMIELEEKLKQLKEDKKQLQQALAELERKRQQQYYKEEAARANAKMQLKSYKANEKFQAMRRSSSCPY